jgi:hypothetical protein
LNIVYIHDRKTMSKESVSPDSSGLNLDGAVVFVPGCMLTIQCDEEDVHETDCDSNAVLLDECSSDTENSNETKYDNNSKRQAEYIALLEPESSEFSKDHDEYLFENNAIPETYNNRRNSGGMLPSPRRSFHSGGMGGGGGPSSSSGSGHMGPGTSRGTAGKSSSSQGHHPGYSQGHHYNQGGNSAPQQAQSQQMSSMHNAQNILKNSRWSTIRKYFHDETQTFFGLNEKPDLREEWLSRRKRFASRRYSERNVDSMPPPSPYQSPMGHLGHGAMMGHGIGHEQPDGRIPTLDQRPGTIVGRVNGRNRRTRKKDHVFVIYWNLIRWIFWVTFCATIVSVQICD